LRPKLEREFNFLIALHFHQPIGNFDYVIERACERCYKPLLDTIEAFPDLKFNLHYSGCLLEWFKRRNPKFFDRIKNLVKKGQAEIIGGGFYEPILAVLSPDDSIEQLTSFSEFLKQEFGVPVNGAWLTERIWEPQLASVLSKAGIRYTIVDDTHLRYSGLKQSQLYGYYMTEDNGKPLSIFPSDKALRYAIPFHPQQESLDYFRRVRDEYNMPSVLYGDDGEKFGEWPGTNEWVYKSGWLNNFLKMLDENSSWLKTMKITDYMKDHAPHGRIYMPCASYQEMSEWSLPAESAERFEGILNELKNKGEFDNYIDFMRGGFWRNFLAKYPESNQMHKRTLFVSKKLRQMESAKEKKTDSLQEAKKELFRSQCNCAYWHGVFGGLYLYHLRTAIYKHLISAEKILDNIEHKKAPWAAISEDDFDCDGHKELIVKTQPSNFIVDPAEGGAITEWDIKQKSINIVNTLSRRREAYHRKLLKDSSGADAANQGPATIHDMQFSNTSLKSKVKYYDDRRRTLCLEHFLPEGVGLDEVSYNLYEDEGDFINGSYKVVRIGKDENPYIELERKGLVKNKPLKLSKKFIFSPNTSRVEVQYEINNISAHSLKLNFAPELNFSLTHAEDPQAFSSIGSLGLFDKVEDIRINIKFSEKTKKLYKYSVNTISQSEKDIEEHYQATCVMPVFTINLAKKEKKTIQIEISSA
jgi:alpha-amylase